MKRIILFCALSVASLSVCAGNTWYVDAANSGKEGLDGVSWATAYATIQAAIDNAATIAGDTVVVRPGTYDQGEPVVDDLGSRNRVLVTKMLTIKSSGARDSVVVVGAWDSTGTSGVGAVAVRCIGVANAAVGTTIQGFTLRGGATPAGDDSYKVSGGGIACLKSKSSEPSPSTVLIDSTIVGCSATRGGGARGITLVRCRVTDCHATANCSAFRQVYAYNCIVQDNDAAKETMGYLCAMVNCTVFGEFAGTLLNASYPVLGDVSIRNTVFLPAGGRSLGAASATKFDHCATSAASFPAGSGNVTGESEILVGPAVGDVRLLSSCGAVGAGNVEALSDIPEAYRDVDFNGNPRTTTAGSVTTVNIGAVETVGTPVAAKMTFTEADGCALTVDGHRVLTNYFYATAWPTQVLVGVAAYPQRKGLLRYNINLGGNNFVARTPPSLADDTLWMMPHPTKVKAVTPVFYQIRYVDDDNYGKSDLDGTTEAKAYGTIADALAKGGNAVIKVLPGTYDRGETFAGYMSNRVAVTVANVRVMATEGPEKTVIVGKGDWENDSVHGVGPAAVRCVYVNTASAVQGFTLTGSRPLSDDASELTKYAGAFYGDEIGMLADAIVSNNYSLSAVYGGYVVRTRFLGNSYDSSDKSDSCVVRACTVANCFFKDNAVARFSHNNTKAYGCTICERNLNASTTFSGSSTLYNNIFYLAQDVTQSTSVTMGGCVFCNASYAKAAAGTAIKTSQDKVFAWGENGDYRLLPSSPAIGFGVTDYDDFSNFATGDVNGKALSFTNGKPSAGAFQESLPQATVTADPAKTLAETMASVSPMDTVLVGPGEYAAGTMLQPNAPDGDSIRARVVVPPYVTLQASGSAAETAIVGASATSGADEWGCGADAVRCVYLSRGSTLRGFTVAGGRVDKTGDNDDDNRGGGIMAVGASATVENCIITNNVASRGGGAFYGVYRRCSFVGNVATVNGAAARQISGYGCLFDANSGPADVAYPITFCSCTFGPNSKNLTGGRAPSVASSEVLGFFTNTLFLSEQAQCVDGKAKLVRCVYPTTLTTQFETEPVRCLVRPSVELQVDAAYRPVVGANVAIDAADDDPITAESEDLSGFQRIMNGRMDIGALEGDWRTAYARKLGNVRRVSVDGVSSAVTNSAGGVVIPNGMLSATLTRPQGSSDDFALTFTVTGTGVLALAVDGAEVGRWTAADGQVEYRPQFAAESCAVTFSYAPGAADEGAATVLSAKYMSGLVLLLR